jgi:DNA-binding phage protein
MLQSAVTFTPLMVRPLQDQLSLRETIRAWLDTVIAKHGVTARKVATQSGIAPSTIYRALEVDGDFVMSTTILAKISNAFNEPMPTGMGGADRHVAGRAGFADQDLVAFVGPAPDMPAKPEDNHYRARVMSDVLNLEHIRPGDVLDFDMRLEPRAGDIVVAQHYNLHRAGAETVLRVYQPPYLLTRSSNPAVDQRPMLVDNERVKIMGTFIRLVRHRP